MNYLSGSIGPNVEGLIDLILIRLINSLQPGKLAWANAFCHSPSKPGPSGPSKINPARAKKHCARCRKVRLWESFRLIRSGMNGRYYLDSYCKVIQEKVLYIPTGKWVCHVRGRYGQSIRAPLFDSQSAAREYGENRKAANAILEAAPQLFIAV